MDTGVSPAGRMGINSIIEEAAREALRGYGRTTELVSGFLGAEPGSVDRSKHARDIIREIMRNHGKASVLASVEELAAVEHGMTKLRPRARDHVAHAVLTFLLGSYIDKEFLGPSGVALDPFEWKIASLLHDVGYPAQMAASLLDDFVEQVKDILCGIDAKASELRAIQGLMGLDRLTNNVDGLDLIQDTILGWGLDIDAHRKYREIRLSEAGSHGMVSGMLVLKVFDLLYEKHNPNRNDDPTSVVGGLDWRQSYFRNHIVPACSAIFIHSLPSPCFEKCRIRRNRASVAFLLRLSDCLQDWERPSGEQSRGFSAQNYHIRVADGLLVFRAPEDRRETIQGEIEAVLVVDDLRFEWAVGP